MTKVEMTRETLLAIAGFTSLKAKQIAAKHVLKKDLKISSERLAFLANRFTKILQDAGSDKRVMALTLRADGFKVFDCITLMMKKGFDIDVTAEQIKELITAAREEL